MNGIGEPSLWWVAIAIQLAIIAAATIRVVATRRRIHSRDVALQYEPPLDVDAATAALLLGQRGRAGTAAILEQAVAGSIRIHRTAHGTFRAEYARAFTGEQRLALQTAIFGRAVTRGAVASVGPRAVRSDEQNLARRGWIWSVRNQPVVRSGAGRAVLLPLLGITLGVLFFFLIVAASATTSASQETYAGWQVLVFFFIASVIASVILLILTLGLPGPSGLAARAHLTGLQTFMLSPEVEGREVLASAGVTARTDIVQLYERLLPYAVAMGIVRQWAHALALELDAAPLCEADPVFRTGGWLVRLPA